MSTERSRVLIVDDEKATTRLLKMTLDQTGKYEVQAENDSTRVVAAALEFRPDIILGFGLLNAFVGIRQAQRAKIPFVYYLIDELHLLVPQRAFRGFARVVEQSNVRRAQLIFSINQALRDYAMDLGARPEKAKVLPAGVDLERYTSGGDGAEIRNRHGLQAGDLVEVTVDGVGYTVGPDCVSVFVAQVVCM